jgi:hypothetical protein
MFGDICCNARVLMAMHPNFDQQAIPPSHAV